MGCNQAAHFRFGGRETFFACFVFTLRFFFWYPLRPWVWPVPAVGPERRGWSVSSLPTSPFSCLRPGPPPGLLSDALVASAKKNRVRGGSVIGEFKSSDVETPRTKMDSCDIDGEVQTVPHWLCRPAPPPCSVICLLSNCRVADAAHTLFSR